MAAGDPGRGRGRDARGPGEIPWRGWKDVLLRVKDEASDDHLALIAAGTGFYTLLALFPAVAALVSIYGLVADPQSIAAQMQALAGIVPPGTLAILEDQLRRVASGESGNLSLAFVGGLLLALWSASKGVKALIEALNVVYEEEEERGFFTLNLVTLVLTLLALLMVVAGLAGAVLLPLILGAAGLGATAETAISILRWPVLLLGAMLVLSVLFRYGPCRRNARWRWITWGSAGAALAWMVFSILFSWFVSRFDTYNETYGSLGAVVALLVWLWLSLTVALFGAELDAEIEHQTRHDSTVGEPRPMGQRGATMADTLGEKRKT